MKKSILLLLCFVLAMSNLFARPEAAPPKRKDLKKVFRFLEANIANPHWLKTEAYREFRELMLSKECLKMDLPQYLIRFERERQHLPFTHFYLRNKKATTAAKKAPAIFFEWRPIRPDVACLDINNFVSDAAGMAKLLQEIDSGDFKHLIIDLRGNSGGTLDMPVILGQYLTQDPIDAGLYLTRKWYEGSETPPAVADYEQFPVLQDMTYRGFGKMLASEKGFRMLLPGHNRKTFQGKVFILIDQYTASACEPLVDLLKKSGRATLVGTTTAGAMLSGQTFTVSKNLEVFLPVADYFTASGARLDKVGVSPHYEVASEKACDFVLSELIK